MSDPVSVSLSLQQVKLLLDSAKFYERMTNDQSAATTITSLQATLVANVNPASPPQGWSSVLAQSATGVVGTAV